MKICLLAGASTIHTVRWVNAMAQLEHDVHLITMHPSKMDQIDSAVHVYKLKVPAPIGYYTNVLELKLLLGRVQPDLLHVHYASGYGTLARLVHFKPTLLSVWGSDVYLFPNKNKRNKMILKNNLASMTHITATGHALKKQTECFHTPAVPIDIVPFGIDMNLFKKLGEIPHEDIVIGTVKRMKPIYGIDLLLKAASRVVEKLKMAGRGEIADRIKLLIVGEGEQLGELKQLADQLGIKERTAFVGAIPNNEVPKYINQMDIYCAFSRSESFGVAVLEASACEVPVVVSNVGGLPEVVQDGVTGYICNLDDLGKMADKLYELVMDEGKRAEFGRNGRKFVRNHYEWQQNVAEMEKIYKKIVQ
ncbi:glycosyltransferase [Virgibacillus halodenitrificans]|uniref:glycosyltransferase n=1 Tax=Virgibacillus halodenitrificans TaxID=1482 RepID=UPI001F1C4730|nr:glycosyltransferase [Virgibacillus halodenitrificans]MCG1027059.1 glycosyltransferase [Virgibacillus halodenitrificans]